MAGASPASFSSRAATATAAAATHPSPLRLEMVGIAAITASIRSDVEAGRNAIDIVVDQFRNLLMDPDFFCIVEESGPLTDFALASRLSYLLWNSTPDEQLLEVARQGKLRDSVVLREQTERMLAVQWGGCLCRHCIAGFRSWLERSVTPQELAKAGVNYLASFDYAAHLRAKNAPSGDAFRRWPEGGQLRTYFQQFQLAN